MLYLSPGCRLLGAQDTGVDTSSCGTPSHAAPEVLSQSRMTKHGDVYAFGIIGEAWGFAILGRRAAGTWEAVQYSKVQYRGSRTFGPVVRQAQQASWSACQ